MHMLLIRYVLLLLCFRLLKSLKNHYLIKFCYMIIRLGIGKLFLLCRIEELCELWWVILQQTLTK